MLSKESALSDLDCVDRLLGMIAPILKDPPNEGGGDADGDAAMQVIYLFTWCTVHGRVGWSTTVRVTWYHI